MSLTEPVLNAAVDGATTLLVYASLHNDSAGTTSANELAGGSPAYARQAVTWDPATGGVAAMDGTELFNVPAGATVARVGLWSAVTAGTFRGSGPTSASEDYAGQGVYELTAMTVTAVND